MLIHCLAGDEQVHDLARAFEDQVDPEVAHDALHRHGLLAPRPQRVRGFVAAAAADLHRLVDDAPPGLGVVQLRDRRLEADVVPAAVRHRAAQLRHRLHGERVRRHRADLLGDRVVFADGPTPLHSLARPLTGNLEAALPGGDRGDWEREPSGIEGDQAQLQTLSHLPQHVLVGHPDVGEAHHPVVDGLQTHEVAAVLDFHTRPRGLHDERGDLPLLLPVHDLGRGARHHHHQFRLGAVGAPQLLAVQEPRLSVLGGHGQRFHGSGVRPDPRFSERERRDRPPREAREVLLLLGVRAEHLERLRHADGLVRGEQGGERTVHRRDEFDRFHVRELRQAQPAVLARDLDAERSQVAQARDHSVGDLSLPVDPVGVDVVAHEPRELVEKRLRARDLLRVPLGVRIDQRHAEPPEEQVAHEAGRGPLLLSGRFRDFARFVGADLAFRGGGGGGAGHRSNLSS